MVCFLKFLDFTLLLIAVLDVCNLRGSWLYLSFELYFHVFVITYFASYRCFWIFGTYIVFTRWYTVNLHTSKNSYAWTIGEYALEFKE